MSTYNNIPDVFISPESRYDFEDLDKFYNYEVPGYVKDAGKDYIVINIDDILDGSVDKKITVKDLITYYIKDARNITSGLRSLAGIHGDWRNIDALANECLEYFKFVDRNGLASVAEKFGLTLRH